MTSTEFRIEHDFLGEREVPVDAYCDVQTQRGAENFPITGYHIHPSLIRAMGIVKNRPARTGRNPRTGEQVTVSEKYVPFFKTGKDMRERLNVGEG